MNKLWIIPFVWIFGGKLARRRLRYIRRAQYWWRYAGEGLVEGLDEVINHIRGECRNYGACVRDRIDGYEIPVPEYLTLEEVTYGWLLA